MVLGKERENTCHNINQDQQNFVPLFHVTELKYHRSTIRQVKLDKLTSPLLVTYLRMH